MIIVRYTTRGTPVYESETGPTLGYDNCETGVTVLADEDGAAEMMADAETYASVEILSDLTETQARELHRSLSRTITAF